MEEKKEKTVTIPIKEYIKMKSDLEEIRKNDVIIRISFESALYPYIEMMFGEKITKKGFYGLPILEIFQNLNKVIETQRESIANMTFSHYKDCSRYNELLRYLSNLSGFDFRVYQQQLRDNQWTTQKEE